MGLWEKAAARSPWAALGLTERVIEASGGPADLLRSVSEGGSLEQGHEDTGQGAKLISKNM